MSKDSTVLVHKQEGTTRAERYLAKLCERTFLSLWSYPNVFRDVFVPGTRVGKEICDLLVLFEDRVLIFSDKDCRVPDTGDLALDWTRWFRRAVLENATQAHGAERWLRQYPNRVFLDKECRQPLPVPFELTPRTRIHRIVVAHNIAARCRAVLGGSGSLLLLNDPAEPAPHARPFTVGDLDSSRSFVHVLDDASLLILLKELDTISDFVAYLDRKEELFRSGRRFLAAGEEEMLAWYLRCTIGNQHYFELPDGENAAVLFDNGLYADYRRNPQAIAKRQANKISYAWDDLIGRFSSSALQGTQDFVSDGGLRDAETIMRFMARESRTRRRVLARVWVDCMTTTPSHRPRTAVLTPSAASDPYYVILMSPWNRVRSDADNQNIRREYLSCLCHIVRLRYPDALDVIGIASESGSSSKVWTETLMYFNFRDWSDESAQEAKEMQDALRFLVHTPEREISESEYPDQVRPPFVPRVGRNERCPCGSGKKYKRCHGSR